MERERSIVGCTMIITILISLITFIVFLTLKLCGAVGWNWFIVFLPISIEVLFIGLTIWILRLVMYTRCLELENMNNK